MENTAQHTGEREVFTVIGPNFEELVTGFARAVAVGLECARFIGLARIFTPDGLEVVRFRGTIGRELGIRPSA